MTSRVSGTPPPKGSGRPSWPSATFGQPLQTIFWDFADGLHIDRSGTDRTRLTYPVPLASDRRPKPGNETRKVSFCKSVQDSQPIHRTTFSPNFFGKQICGDPLQGIRTLNFHVGVGPEPCADLLHHFRRALDSRPECVGLPPSGLRVGSEPFGFCDQ